MRTLHNPVIRGFFPDPSICRKGDDYYLVNSSFEFFPAVPLFHSTDLADWKQIGFCITDPKTISLKGARSGKGIYAPTIRYNPDDDMFYMITVLCHDDDYHHNEIFYVKAKDPEGSWSDKTVIKGAEGIDPSLFFEDGKAWYVGNLRPSVEDTHHRHIWLQELDLKTGTLLGKRTIILTDGALHEARCPEGPHIYHIGEYYYLLIAEGGTSLNHAISIFRSKRITGPYEINPRNPILTHRGMGKQYQKFNAIGHADLVQAPDGSWWAALLGVRPYVDPDLRNLGRETFIVPVIWEDGWPVFCPETGHVEESYAMPWETHETLVSSFTDFTSLKLEACWECLREPSYRFTGEGLALRLKPFSFLDNDAAAFVGRRQQERHFIAETMMTFTPSQDNEGAGLLVELNSKSFYLLEKTRKQGIDRLVLRDYEEVYAEKPCPEGPLFLRACASGLDYWFEVRDQDGRWRQFGPMLNGRSLSRLEAGFTGVLIGMYGSSHGKQTNSEAVYRYFHYQDKE